MPFFVTVRSISLRPKPLFSLITSLSALGRKWRCFFGHIRHDQGKGRGGTGYRVIETPVNTNTQNNSLPFFISVFRKISGRSPIYTKICHHGIWRLIYTKNMLTKKEQFRGSVHRRQGRPHWSWSSVPKWKNKTHFSSLKQPLCWRLRLLPALFSYFLRQE